MLRTLYGYHAWANQDLFGKLERLDPDAHGAERHVAMRLIHHCHVVARIFAAHLTGATHDHPSSNTADTPPLDKLRAAVATSDRWYLDYVERLSPAELSERIPFTFTDGDNGFMSREEMLTHLVLHAGYHRGEVGRVLAQLSVTPPWDTFAVYLHQTEPSRRLQGSIPA